MRVELVVLQFHRLAQRLALHGTLSGIRLASLDPGEHLLFGQRTRDAQRVEDLPKLPRRLVGSGHDLPRDRGSLGGVGVEQLGVALPAQHRRELPHQVVGVLDRGVRAQTVAWRVPVHRIAGAEHPPRLECGRVHLVVAPQAVTLDLDVEVWHTHQVSHDLGGGHIVELRRLRVDVVAPDD